MDTIVLPSVDEIFNAIELSRKEAVGHAIEFGFMIDRNDPCECKLKSQMRRTTTEKEIIPVPKKDAIMRLKRSLQFISLINYKEKFENKIIPENSSYVEVWNDSKKRIVLLSSISSTYALYAYKKKSYRKKKHRQ